ncbi:MAG TPA: hypothetical protein VGF06_09520 [Terriglobales bacterium]
MHRWTARILLVLLLVSTFAPAALAIDGPPQHACCMRARHAHPGGTTLAAVHPRDGNCCPPITTTSGAQVSVWATVRIGQVQHRTYGGFHRLILLSPDEGSHSGRAPPAFFFA